MVRNLRREYLKAILNLWRESMTAARPPPALVISNDIVGYKPFDDDWDNLLVAIVQLFFYSKIIVPIYAFIGLLF